MLDRETITTHFVERFTAGATFASISQARQETDRVFDTKIVPGTPEAKAVDEAIELSLVKVARAIAATTTGGLETYDQLLNLYERQPILGVRSSTSIRQQAYSTALPIAYLASALAGINRQTTVFEPTAGNGSLLIAADPANVTVNELNVERANQLRTQGFTVTEHDAVTYLPDLLHDVVIANPPFGRVRGRRFELPGTTRGTSQIDQAIAFQSLKAMKSDGRAVLILGGKPETEVAQRADAYNALETRRFFYLLYQKYDVEDHFTVSGDLYRKQGASWPIDLIVIGGEGKSLRLLPAVVPPRIYTSFDELKDKLRGRSNEITQLQKLSDLQQSVATGRDRPSESIRRSDTTGPTENDPQVLLGSDELSNRMDDFAGDGTGGAIGTGAANYVPGDFESPAPDSRSSVAVRGRSDRKRSSSDETNLDLGFRLGHEPTGTEQQVDGAISSPERRSDFPSRSASSPNQRFFNRNSAARLSESPDLSDRTQNSLETAPTPQEEQKHYSQDTTQERVMAQDLYASYKPKSKGRSPGTLIPTNLALPAQQALDACERTHGNVDEFVMHRLGYGSTDQMYGVLYAEQIDALALAFDQKDRGKIFLNGDQTGNGKGRFGAANIIDAQRQGYIPVFVTQKPNLYKSMLEDLADIGFSDIQPFFTNNNERIALSSGRVLRTGNAASQSEEMRAIAQQGDLGGYDTIFTTYNQLQSVNKKDTPRREFLRAIVEQCVFIFDESHEAGGSVNKQDAWSSGGVMNRADFVRWLVDNSASAIFMSATATKDPAVMDLYARGTDAVHAVSSMAKLENTLKAGGIPLQQMMAAQFGYAGNMLRRERSMENISFQAKSVGVDHEIADRISGIMRAIDQFDRAKRVALKELNKEVRQEAKAAGEDNAIGQSGAKSQNFTSLMHNAIEQGLLAQKAEATVQEAISALQKGEKPVIAVANTMDAFIGNYVEDRGIRPGEPIDISFGDILARYLERSRDVTITDYVGDRERRPMTDAELGIEGIAAFEYADALIANSDFSSIPLSSIDYIKHRLSQSGYRADEITGRSNIINYGEAGEQFYGLRPQSQIKAQGKIDVVDRFNDGQLDVVILNRSGATGINLHASEKFSDQSVRHLIMAQPERDINQVMQMLGRVNRFGQVTEPKITLVVADIPAEKRLGAMLAKKMSSLNANTTGDRESDLTVSNVADFMNAAGEEVVTELLEEQPEINELLSFPMKGATGDSDTELISRVTGRIPLLPIEKQEELYSYIEAETIALIEQKAAMGENVLEADKLDLDARTLATMTVVPKDSQIDSQFTGPVVLEVVDAKVTKKPPTQLAVVNIVRQSLDQPLIEDIAQHDFSRIQESSRKHGQSLLEQGGQAVEDYRKRRLSKAKQAETADKIGQKLDDQLETLDVIITSYPIGASVTLTTAGKKDTLNHSYGVVVDLSKKATSMGSPGAPTNWVMKIATLEGQQLSIPFSKVNSKTGSGVIVNASESTWRGNSIYEEFDRLQLAQRTERQVFTGNLLKAYQKFPQGKFVSFTDNAGNTRQGLLMSEKFDIAAELLRQPVIFDEPRQVRTFLERLSGGLGTVHTLDSVLAIKPDGKARFGGGEADYFIFIVPKATKVGGRFFLNENLLEEAESEFFSVGDRMEMKVPAENFEAALSVLMNESETQIAVLDEKFTQQVRSFLGHSLPQLEESAVANVVEPVSQPDSRDFIAASSPISSQSELDLSAAPTAAQEKLPVDKPISERNGDISATTIASPDSASQLEGDVGMLRPSQALADEVDAKSADSGAVEINSQPSVRQPQDHRQMAEKRIARFLHDAGLAEAVMDDDGFHLRIENEPYIPLVIESHSLGVNQEIYLTHYIEVGRDKELIHDGELVFVSSADGYLRFKETAVQNALTGGELRAPDRSFAGIFAKNILEQGFAEAALRQQQSVTQSPEESRRADTSDIEPQTDLDRGSGRQSVDFKIVHSDDYGSGEFTIRRRVDELFVAEDDSSDNWRVGIQGLAGVTSNHAEFVEAVRALSQVASDRTFSEGVSLLLNPDNLDMENLGVIALKFRNEIDGNASSPNIQSEILSGDSEGRDVGVNDEGQVQSELIARTDAPVEKTMESLPTASAESVELPDDTLISQVLRELTDIHADGVIANLVEMPSVRNLPSMADLARPLQDEVLHALSRLHQIEMIPLEDLGDRSEADLGEGILQEDGSNLFHVSIYNQFERHSDIAVKTHLNPIVTELEILSEGADAIAVAQYSELESLQFQLRYISASNKEFHASSMLVTLQGMGGLTIIQPDSEEPYRGDISDLLTSGAVIQLIPHHRDTENSLAEARLKFSRTIPYEVTTELSNRLVELKTREEFFGISSKDWSDDLTHQAISQTIPLRQHVYEQGNLSSAQALAAAEAYATAHLQPQHLTPELSTALEFADTVVALQTELDEIIDARTKNPQARSLESELPDVKTRAHKIVSDLEGLGIPAAHDLPKSWLDSAAPPFNYEMTLRAVSEAISESALSVDVEAVIEAARGKNNTILSDRGEPAMTYVVNAIEKSDPLLGVEAESKLPSLSMPMADFRRALRAAKYVGNEHLANDINAVLENAPKTEEILLSESFHNQTQETLSLAKAKQQKSFSDVIVPLASKLLKTADDAGLVTRGRDVIAFEGKNYSIRRRGNELKVYCHGTDGFIHAKDDIPIQNRNLSMQDRETFKRFSAKSVDQLRASVLKKEQSAGLDAIR